MLNSICLKDTNSDWSKAHHYANKAFNLLVNELEDEASIENHETMEIK
jgi:hypothetical protein